MRQNDESSIVARDDEVFTKQLHSRHDAVALQTRVCPSTEYSNPRTNYMLSEESVFTRVTRGLYVASVIVLCGFISAPVLADKAVKSSAAATAAPAAGPRASIEKVTAVEGITEYRLSNGLRVLLFPDQSKPTIT